jgi:hypothetical protein
VLWEISMSKIHLTVCRVIFAFTIVISILTKGGFSQTSNCSYYASPSGGGNGLSQSSPFQIANFWSVAGPGKTLCLLDGVYTGANSMIHPPDGLSGLSGNPITVKALNDGGVRINGEAARIPLNLSVVGWFVVEGVNVHNSAFDAVVIINRGSHDVILRRVIAWDAPVDQNYHVWSIRNAGTRNILIEDSAGFGKGRKILEYFSTSSSDNLTVRRFWGQWSQNTYPGPKHAVSGAYNAYHFLGENIIATWDATPMGNSAVDQPTNVIGMDRQDGSNPSDIRYYGSIAYVRAADSLDALDFGLFGASSNIQGITIANSAAYIEPGTHTGIKPFGLDNYSGGDSARFLTNTTEIGGASSTIGSQWVQANRVDVGTVAQAPNIWNGSGTQGARVCKQYVNGALTSNPLWPWPMDARIRAALSAAGKNPDAIFGGTGNSVTALMEQIFGPIPSECRTGSQLPAAPTNLAITSP